MTIMLAARTLYLFGKKLAIVAIYGAHLVFVMHALEAIAQFAAVPPSESAVKPKVIEGSGLLLEQLREAATFGAILTDVLTIDQIVVAEGRVLGARKLVFRPNAKLVLAARPSDAPIRILADEIEVQGDGAAITWIGPGPGESVPPPRGKAPDGLPGRNHGERGGPGADGEPGTAGYRGTSAPIVHLYVRRVTGKRLIIDLRGQAGATGGVGQTGGDGGRGAKGEPATALLVGCARGPGRGGAGGPGGNAGNGGTGGRGGDGGTVSLITANPDIGSFFSVFLGGGVGGTGGKPGRHGEGGIGGPEGDPAQPFCQPVGNRTGDRGAEGKAGIAGTAGPQGAAGSYSILQVGDRQIDLIFSPGTPR